MVHKQNWLLAITVIAILSVSVASCVPGKTAEDTLVEEIMTERVICVRPEQTTEECMALMTDKHVRHLPVAEEGQVTGVISIGDVVKSIISEQEFTIEQLENYIAGTPYRPRQSGDSG